MFANIFEADKNTGIGVCFGHAQARRVRYGYHVERTLA